MTTINHESYVSLEIAKLLKEAGFDWECRYYYLGDTNIIIDTEYESLEFSSLFYPKPTLEVAQRWLRETYFRDVLIFLDDKKYNVYIYNNEGTNCKMIYYSPNIYGTYEEAKEAGIKKALELILEK